MKKIRLLIFFGLIGYSVFISSQELYRWVDEKGVVHFSDDLTKVPEKYRDQVHTKKPPKEPTPPSPIPRGTETEKESESAPVKKDLLGRGEEWWQAKVKEWNDRLREAQKNYETNYSAWKAKERELEESRFKPDSLKRRLKTEIKALEEKTKEWEKPVEEVKTMLEKVLPKQAEDYKADPNWLKLKER
ncbi:MAG: DUF4124 domain-containing protein [Thermodesulfobacteriota bacterium]